MNSGESMKCEETGFIMSSGMLEGNQFAEKTGSFLGKLFHNGFGLVRQQGSFLSVQSKQLVFNVLFNILDGSLELNLLDSGEIWFRSLV